MDRSSKPPASIPASPLPTIGNSAVPIGIPAVPIGIPARPLWHAIAVS
ncbi:hypothetical protein VR010_13685 [Actinomycetaceae bacterium L2_0104]